MSATSPGTGAASQTLPRPGGSLSGEEDGSTVPLVGLVVVVHDAAAHLPGFLAALEGQRLPLEQLEVVAVDCGSRDDSLAQLAAWARRHPRTVQVVSAPGASMGTARNTGLKRTRAPWVSFPRVCDGFDREYLARIATYAAENPAMALVSANRLVLDGTGEVTNNHPLRMFHRGDRTLDLAALPEVIVGDPVATFFRTDLVREHDVRFADLWSGALEPADFAWRLLLRAGTQVGLMRSAKYVQNREVATTARLPSMLPPSGTEEDEDPTLTMLRDAYLHTLQEAERSGSAPEWLQHQVAYALAPFYATNDSRPPLGVPTGAAQRQAFHQQVGEILAHIDVDAVVPYLMGRVRRLARYALQHGYRETPWRQAYVLMDKLDEEQKLVRMSYYYTGPDPVEEYRCNGVRVEPIHGKTRELHYTGRLLLKNRIAWVPFRGLMEARLDGVPADLAFEYPPFPRKRVTQGVAGWFVRPDSTRVTAPADRVRPRTPESREGRKAQRVAARARAHRTYAEAWVLMDRLHDGGDNAEALFKHLRRDEPSINAWFVLEESSPHWARLVAEGYGDRMVAHGTVEWRVLMLHARHLLSSHADLAVTAPKEINEIRRMDWRFTFLQHGVIMFDLSNWLNGKSLDVLVTSTTGEYHSIAGDTSQYNVTTREVALTGMPRWDRLLELSREYDESRRDLILVAPTWRKWLLPPLVPGSQRRPLDLSALDSDFFRSWKTFLSDERLAKLALDHGLRVGFLPHPNLQPLLGHLDLPAHVQPLTYADHNVQELISRARLMVTDYSSIAFDAAYISRPVTYFQFDTEHMLEGSHVGSRGYFDFETDGFGPVAHTLDDAVRAVEDVIEAGPAPMPRYADRIEATFPERDGRCSARVVAAVRRSTTPQADGPPVPTPAASRPWR